MRSSVVIIPRRGPEKRRHIASCPIKADQKGDGAAMATNPQAVELAKKNKVEYEWGTLWPHYHKEKMNWGGGFKTKGDVDILFLAGETGRDPFEDAPCRTPEEERAGRGKVVSMDVKQQTRQCLEYIKNKLEMMDATSTLSCSATTCRAGRMFS